MPGPSLFVGTSGYSYKEWKGSFYPRDLPAKGMLRYYAERFGAVESNSTFYRLPTAKVVKSWAAEVPAGFRFALKAPQRITHFQRLKGARGSVSQFLRVAAVLGDRLGPLLFQLPPNFKKDVPRLEAFLALLPAGTRAAFEFRHASWFDDETFDILRARGAALCIAEDEDLATPFEATAKWGYLRLRRLDYTRADLSAWAKRVRRQTWGEAFVFFKHEDTGRGPVFAKKFLELGARAR